MKTITLTLFMFFASCLLAQTTYESAMKSALESWSKAEKPEELTATVQQFEQIAKKDTTKWEPLYYAILIKTYQSFSLPKDEAFDTIDDLRQDYEKLKSIENNDEIQILEALFQTVIIAKDPMNYGSTLYFSIQNIYEKILIENPNNPRAIYNLAKFRMNGAKYLGENPKNYCPDVEKAIKLFEEEKESKKMGFHPTWGKSQAEKLWSDKCYK